MPGREGVSMGAFGGMLDQVTWVAMTVHDE